MQCVMSGRAFVCLVGVSVLLLGCGAVGSVGNSGGGTPPSPSLRSITITPSNVAVNAGQTQQLAATGTYSDGSTKDLTPSATWSSSSTSIATVSTTGLLTSLAQGQVSISATSAGVVGSEQITVNPKGLISIAISPASLTLIAGQTQQLSATGIYTDGSTADVTSTASWDSSSKSVASITGSGLVTSITAGQTTISASLSGVVGSNQISVNAKALVSIDVSPATADLGIHILQQYAALGTYNDGTVADVTQSATWSSSSTSSATVTGQGIVNTVAPGDVNITATVGSLQGTAKLTVNSSTDGLVFVNDLTDSRLASFSGSDGSSVWFYGDRDQNGTPSALTGASATASTGEQATFFFDTQGRPQSIRLSDSSQFLFSWSSATSGVVSVIGKDGASTISAPITLPPVQSAQISSHSAALKPNSTSTTNAPSITVHVTSCNGSNNEDFAAVTLWTPNQTIPARLSAPGTGDYSAQLPLALTAGQQTALNTLNGVCTVPSYIGNACTAIKVALVLAEGGIPLAAAGAINSACSDLSIFEAIVGNTCTGISSTSSYNSSIAWLDKQFLGVPITVSLPGAPTEQALAAPAPGSGLYPIVNVDLSCPNVDHVDVTPAKASIDVGQSIPLIATARDANDIIRFSSAFRFNWDAGNSLLLLSSPEFQGDEPFGTDDVKGMSPGGPVTITATENSSGKSGQSAITVQPVGLYGTVYNGTLLNLDSINTSTGIQTPIVALNTQGTLGIDDPAFGKGRFYYYSSTGTGLAQLLMVDTTLHTPSVSTIGNPQTEPEVMFVDNATGNLYGTVYNGTSLNLDSIDPGTGVQTPIVAINTQGTLGIDTPAFGNGRFYYYSSTGTTGLAQLMMIDTTAQTPSVSAIGAPQPEPEVMFVDNASGKLYGTVYNGTSLNLDSIDPSTGVQTPIVAINIQGTLGIDAPAFGNGRFYYYSSTGTTGLAQLMMIDTTAQTPSVSAIGDPQPEPETLFVNK